MSNQMHANATLKGYGYPVFPEILDQFYQVLKISGISNRILFESAFKRLPEFVCQVPVSLNTL